MINTPSLRGAAATRQSMPPEDTDRHAALAMTKGSLTIKMPIQVNHKETA
jgi:hypothetical protein